MAWSRLLSSLKDYVKVRPCWGRLEALWGPLSLNLLVKKNSPSRALLLCYLRGKRNCVTSGSSSTCDTFWKWYPVKFHIINPHHTQRSCFFFFLIVSLHTHCDGYICVCLTLHMRVLEVLRGRQRAHPWGVCVWCTWAECLFSPAPEPPAAHRSEMFRCFAQRSSWQLAAKGKC